MRKVCAPPLPTGAPPRPRRRPSRPRARAGECVQQLSGHTAAGGAAGENAILDLAFSPDSSLLLTACGNGSVTLWSCRSGAALAQYASHAAAAEAVAWRGDGGVFASSSWDGEIHVYRLEGGGERGDVRGTRLRELKGHTVGVDNIVWAPNQWLLASYAEKHIKLWSIHQVRAWQAVRL